MAVAQWVNHSSINYEVVQAEGSRRRKDDYQNPLSNDFYFRLFFLLGQMDFSDIVICIIGQIVVVNRILSVFFH